LEVFVEFVFSVLSVVCYLGLLLGVSNVVGAVCGYYFHILTTMHGQNHIKLIKSSWILCIWMTFQRYWSEIRCQTEYRGDSTFTGNVSVDPDRV